MIIRVAVKQHNGPVAAGVQTENVEIVDRRIASEAGVVQDFLARPFLMHSYG